MGDLPLLTRAETLSYLQAVLDRLAGRLDSGMATEQDSFIYQFGIFHEDMHTEAFLWARQALAYPKPALAALFPAINAKGSEWEVAVMGVSCRQQVEHGTGRRARHLVEVLRDALP